MLKMGCCTYNFRSWDLEESLRFIRNLHFAHASVGAFDSASQVNPLQAAAEPVRTGRFIRETAEKYELALVELFMCSVWIDERTRVSPSHPDAARRSAMLKQFQALCLCAKEAGLTNVMGVPGDLRDAPNADAAWESAVAALNQMVRIAGEIGIGFSVEPHIGSIISSRASAERLLRDVPGLAFSLDYAQLLNQGVALDDIIPLHGHAVHVHLKPAKTGVGKVLMHDSDIDYGAIIADLSARAWNGVICIECIYDTRSRSFTEHPAYQSVLLTHHIERIAGSERIEHRTI